MTEYCCDRCGHKITNPGEMSYIDLFKIGLPETLLCDKCIEDLKNWYHKKPNPCGHWEFKGYDEIIEETVYECTECGFNSDWCYNYCPNCGVKMRSNEDSNNYYGVKTALLKDEVKE